MPCSGSYPAVEALWMPFCGRVTDWLRMDIVPYLTFCNDKSKEVVTVLLTWIYIISES
jgi:hypothetical protein